MITEAEIPLIIFPLRKQDDEEDDYYEPSEEEKRHISDAFNAFLNGIAAAVILGQSRGLTASAMEGARSAGGGLTHTQLQRSIEEAANFNAEHFSGLKDDAVDALKTLLASGKIKDDQDLQDKLSDLMDAISNRAERYAKGGGNAAWSSALRAAGEANGVEGGIWDCNFGPGSCKDCETLHGQWLSWDEFDDTYQQTECDGGCNCGFHAAENPEALLLEDLEEEVA